MKNLIPIFLVVLLITGCVQPQPETHQVEIGLFTPYYLFPDILNGQVKEVYERSYLTVEQDGNYIKGDRLTVAARDTIGWTNDFHLMYDENGTLMQADLIDENDELISRDKNSVEDGKVVQSEFFKKDTLRAISKFTYNENGVLTGIERIRMPEDTIFVNIMLVSDESGNFTEWHFHNPAGGLNGKFMFTVNQEGRRTGYAFYNKDGEKTIEQKYTFNDKGSMLKQEIINKDGEVFVSEYEYEYDDMDNWIKTTGKTGDQVIMTERAITYYE